MIQALFLVPLVVCLSALDTVHASVPSSVNIGGMFSLFDSNGVVQNDAVQYLSAFLMAVEDINNKTDGIFDDVLPGTTLKFAIRGTPRRYDNVIQADELLSSVDIEGEIGIHVLVNGLISGIGEPGVNDIFREIVRDFSASMIQATVDGSYDGEEENTAVHMFPLPVDEGMVLQHLICNHFDYRRVGVLYEPGHFGDAALDRFKSGEFCDFDLAFEIPLGADTVASGVDTLKSQFSDVRVFVILYGDAAVVGELLERGYVTGLFREGRQIFLVEEAMDIPALRSAVSPSVDLAVLLKGVIGTKFWPTYMFESLSRGADFLERWSQRPSTAGTPGGPCDTTVDGSGSRFLYQNDAGTVCAGLDYSSFSSVDDLSPLVPFVYDSVIAAAVGLHHLLVTQSLPLSSSAAAYREAVLAGLIAHDPVEGILYHLLSVLCQQTCTDSFFLYRSFWSP